MLTKDCVKESEQIHGYNRTLVVQLKSRKNKSKSPKKQKVKGLGFDSSTYMNNISPGVMYVMNAKLTKKVLI